MLDLPSIRLRETCVEPKNHLQARFRYIGAGVNTPELFRLNPFFSSKQVPVVQDYYHIHKTKNLVQQYVDDGGGEEEGSDEFEDESEAGYDSYRSSHDDDVLSLSSDESFDSDDHDFIVYSDEGNASDASFGGNDDDMDSASETSEDSQDFFDEGSWSDVEVEDNVFEENVTEHQSAVEET